jgi:hypothetical protein
MKTSPKWTWAEAVDIAGGLGLLISGLVLWFVAASL